MQIVVLELNKPTKNNRLYTTKVIEQMLSSVREPVLGGIGMPVCLNSIDLNQATHAIANLRIEGNKLVGELTVLKTPINIREDFFTDSRVSFRPAGTGMVDSEGRVSDYKLLSINAVFAEEAA